MAQITAYLYERCGTCRKAKKWFSQHGIEMKEIPIVEQPPTKEEIATMWQKSGLPLKKFFNTSGELYRSMGLKDKLPTMSEAEMLDLLAQNGKLLKRPIVTDGERVTVGFNEDEFRQVWLNK